MRKTKIVLNLLVALTLAFGFLGCKSGGGPGRGSTADIAALGNSNTSNANLREYLVVAERGVNYLPVPGSTASPQPVYVNDALAQARVYQLTGVTAKPTPNGTLTEVTGTSPFNWSGQFTFNSGVGLCGLAVDDISRTSGSPTGAPYPRVFFAVRNQVYNPTSATDPTNSDTSAAFFTDEDFYINPLDASSNPGVPNLQATAANEVTTFGFLHYDFANVAFSPTGQFVYLVTAPPTGGLGSLTEYSYNAATGGYNPLSAAATMPTGPEPRDIVVSHNGKYVYVSNFGNGTISEFSVDPNTGQMAALGAPVPTGGAGTFGLTLDRTGNYLYYADTGYFYGDSGDAAPGGVAGIGGFKINSDGSLTPIKVDGVTSGPASYGGMVSPCGIAASPVTDTIYCTDFGANAVAGFRVHTDQDGLLTNLPGGLIPLAPAQYHPVNIVVDATGRFLFTADQADAGFTSFGVQLPSGRPTPTHNGGICEFRILSNDSLGVPTAIPLENPYGLAIVPVILNNP